MYKNGKRLFLKQSLNFIYEDNRGNLKSMFMIFSSSSVTTKGIGNRSFSRRGNCILYFDI